MKETKNSMMQRAFHELKKCIIRNRVNFRSINLKVGRSTIRLFGTFQNHTLPNVPIKKRSSIMENQLLVNTRKKENQDEPWQLETKKQEIKVKITGKFMKRIAETWKSLSFRFQINFSKHDHPAYYHGESFVPDQSRARILPNERQFILH